MKTGVFGVLATCGGLLALAAQAQTKNASAKVTLGVYFTGSCASGRAGTPMALAGTSKTYCLQPRALVDQRDVVSAGFDRDALDKSTIQVTLTPNAAQRLRALTAKSIGLQIGVVLSSQLVSVATIAAGTDRVWIARLTPDRAEMVIRAFRAPRK